MMALRNIIARAALQRGWELICSSSIMQEFREGDTTIKVRYLHNGAIWHGEWLRGGTRRDLDSHDPNKREVIIAWLEEGGAASRDN
jgi:tRNA G10  N-methylase Trm11